MPVETQYQPRTATRDDEQRTAAATDVPRAAGPKSPEARAAAALAGRRAAQEAPAASGDALTNSAPTASALTAPAAHASPTTSPAQTASATDDGTAGLCGPGSAPEGPGPTSGAGPARRRELRSAQPAATLIPVPRVMQDVVLLLGRLVVGVVLIAHGVQKLTQGVAGTAGGFAQMGIPVPEAAAVFAMVAEIGGGALLILGLLTPLAALLPAVVMAGAAVVHAGSGIFVTEGGWEFAATLGVAALVLGAVGPGRLSVDAAIARALRARRTR